jgi:N-acetylneuraminate synthase
MSGQVRIGDRLVGPGEPAYVIAEIGINHNGDVELARALVEAAARAGADAVKLQKRTVDVVYSPDELQRARDSPFGSTNGDLKYGLEFDENSYRSIAEWCAAQRLHWSASCWDEASVDFVAAFDPPWFKVSSASLTDTELLRHHRRYGKPIILSTGMSTIEEIDTAVEALGTDDLILMHTTSTYPSVIDELNLRTISMLEERYGVPVGYSGHEVGLAPSVAAVALGACVVERHITLDRAMWGSDQAASVEPQGFERLVRDIRVVERALGDGVKRVYESELEVRKKLRRVP